MRIMSRESANRVYHRPECRYAGKIRKRNRIQMEWEDAEWKGYRPCKCCGGIDFLRFILLHRNYVNGRIALEDAENAPFHRQGDIPGAGSIMKYLKYIKAHDEFKQNKPADYRKMPQDTERQKAYYRAAKKRAERSSAKRLDSLFLLIEKQEGMRQLSCC